MTVVVAIAQLATEEEEDEEVEVVPVFVQVVAQQADGVRAEHLEDEGLVTVL